MIFRKVKNLNYCILANNNLLCYDNENKIKLIIMKVNLNEARKKLSALLKNIEKEEVIILKHGKEVARIVLVKKVPKTKKLPSLKKFRATIQSKGVPLSKEIIKERNVSRY